MYRKIEERIEKFLQSTGKKALLITGARQVGKTYIVEKVGKRQDFGYFKINFLENPDARALFSDFRDTKDILLRLSALSDIEFIAGKTLIFFDEVQECPEIVTAIKFLVEEGSYRYILSGSLLGVILKDIRSVPVGYMDVIEMYPLNFEEFSIANSISSDVLEHIRSAYESRTPVDSLIHEKMMRLFHLYLIVGGMPAAVQKYLDTNNIREVVDIQNSILYLYKKDISKYDPDNKLYLEEIFEYIPSELNAKNKRFILKDLNEHFKFNRYQNSFIWLKDAGGALPTFCVKEPEVPLMMSKSTNLFKLFLADVGLLAAMYAGGIQIKILNRDSNINFGSIYENAVAQELKSHGFSLYYLNSKKNGELDFLVELDGKVLPIEVKSGKNYTRHSALNRVLDVYPNIEEAAVLHIENLKTNGCITYFPIYMMMYLKNDEIPEDFIYTIE